MDGKLGSLLGVSSETMNERNAKSWSKIMARTGLALVMLMLWSCAPMWPGTSVVRMRWSGYGGKTHSEKEFNAKSWNEVSEAST